VAFFAWPTTLRKILTIDNLRKWHVIEVNWFVCKRCEESMDYLFLHFEIASALWCTIFSHVSLTLVVHLLKRVEWQFLECNRVEDDFVLSFLVYFGGK
jgi:hypothetical protein